MNIIKKLVDQLNQAQIWQKSVILPRNDFVAFKGDMNTNLYFIERGSVKIYFEHQGVEQIIRLGYSGNLIVSLDSYITEQPTDFYIQTLKKTTLKIVSKAAFTQFLKEDAQRLLIWQNILELMIFQQLEREKDILIPSPQERYLRVLQRSPRLFQEIPNKYIASYLRMTPETLSRLKSKS